MPAPLRRASLITSCARVCRLSQRSFASGRRSLQVSTSPAETLDILPADSSIGATPDARFEVLGSPFSLLSASLSASQDLYTRKGSLVGVGGNPENAVSTLSILEPFRRAFLRIPFVYQRISSTTPVTALIATKSTSTSMTVVHLDGSTDWMLAGQALLAWTGQTLFVSPVMNRKMSLAHWGNSEVTGRGLLALAGQGSISQIALKDGETYVVHPGSVLAYTINRNPPLPYRLKSSSLRFQVPDLSRAFPETRFIRSMRESATWQTITKTLLTLRTWSRATIWGDRLFLQFHGPTTILLQTRASRISDVLTSRDVNEIADTQPGVIQPLVTLSRYASKVESSNQGKAAATVTAKALKMHTASIGSDGKVTFEPTGVSTSVK